MKAWSVVIVVSMSILLYNEGIAQNHLKSHNFINKPEKKIKIVKNTQLNGNDKITPEPKSHKGIIILGPESFEGNFPPPGWSQFSWSNSSYHWYKAQNSGHQGNYVAWIDFDPYNTQDEVLQTPPLNLSNFVACTLSFYFWQSEYYEDYLFIGVSTNGGGPNGNWEWIGSLYQTGSNWDEVIVDLSNYCGYSNVVIGFDYYTQTPDQESEGIDYVVVRAVPQPKPWSIFVFMNGDNNLEGFAIDDINEMERAIDTTKYNLIVELDRIPGYDNSNGDWTTTRDYRITYDPNNDRIIRSQLLQDFGELNMGDPTTFINFVNRYINTYPAQKYLIILWDHGDGWYKKESKKDPLFKGIGPDSTNNDILGVANHEYYNALNAISSYLGRQIDILAHDACLMGMVEVGYEAKNFANFLVFSEHTEPGYGYPYKDILEWLNANPNATPQQLATAIVNKYIQSYQPGGSQYDQQSVTQSAITTGAAFNALTQKINHFAYELMKAGGRERPEIELARFLSQEYAIPHHIDLYDFAKNIKDISTLPQSLRNAADSVMNKINATVIAEGHYSDPNDSNVDNSHGLAIYYPAEIESLNYTYSQLYFASDLPNWWHFLCGMSAEEYSSHRNSPYNFVLLPNLSNGQIAIQYVLPREAYVSIKIYDFMGRFIKTIVNNKENMGYHIKYWNCSTYNGKKVDAGIYFCKIKIDTFSAVQKFIIMP
jgi:hypothetical protein